MKILSAESVNCDIRPAQNAITKTRLTRFSIKSGPRRKQLLTSLIALGIILPGVSLTMNSSIFASKSVPSLSPTPTLKVTTEDATGATLTGYYVALYQSGVPIASGYSPATFTLIAGVTYTVESYGYGYCTFDRWLDTGSTSSQREVAIASDTTLTAVLNCGSETTTTSTTTSATASTTSTSVTTTSTSAGSTGVTVYAHRIPASYWDPCFATTCTNPYASCDASCTGPGVTMYFEVYDSAGNFIEGGFANENGFTFTGLVPGVTYYVYPDDCNMCHGSVHDVVFQHWSDGSTVRPIAVAPGQSLDAWYSCTNSCA